MEAIFVHFLRQQSTAASENSSFLNWNIFYSQCFIPASGKELFCLLETVLFYSEISLLVETIIETWRRKDKHIPASEYQFFQYFQRF